MGPGPVDRLYVPGASRVHRLPPQTKIVAVLAFVLLVVATPRERMWAFGVYALLLAAVALLARVPFRTVARRTVIEVPFVAFAILIPFVAEGEKIGVLGLRVSEGGLWDAWNILAKGTLGVVASILLAATTEPRVLLLGIERLRMPPLLTQIAAFMLRYADVVAAELGRMRVARASRGFEARDIRATRVLARSIGALFLRSYERGERVHLAMLSRGYDGRMPVMHDAATNGTGATAAQWTAAAVLPSAAALVALAAWIAP
ncbi:cobalt ECF transporter T component CbiQ [Actinomadura sp. 7K507]|uniref:cobalt ECF transporter T component CbiQ n=1 Tax=Actinomadura sp. 7K507 TaxID=2530365 RepID=UPI0010446CEC|nr:cobalt ECF transporter T component CbiQ [Actinomadura sp. 7K507]TDC88092.1 cobalt ECF transporter T component CbiQ [Actinomadura sp. 7K507]